MNNVIDNIVPNLNDVTDLVLADNIEEAFPPVINNLGGKLDPFVEIHKQPTFLPSGKQSGAFSVTLGESEKEVGIVKENYLLVENLIRYSLMESNLEKFMLLRMLGWRFKFLKLVIYLDWYLKYKTVTTLVLKLVSMFTFKG